MLESTMVRRTRSPRHLLDEALRHDDADQARKAMALGADPSAERPSGRGNFLNHAVAIDAQACLALFLTSSPLPQHALLDCARAAVLEHATGALRALLDAGLSLDAKAGGDGMDLATYAAHHGSDKALSLLLSAGIDPNGAPENASEGGWTPLMHCARAGEFPEAIAMGLALLERGALTELMARDDRYRAMDVASRNGGWTLCRALIERGSPVKQAHEVADTFGYPDLARFLRAASIAQQDKRELSGSTIPGAQPPKTGARL